MAVAKRGAGGGRRKKAAKAPRGVEMAGVLDVPAAAVAPTVAEVEGAGGRVLAAYREPLGGHPVVFAALPVERVEPTPYQRDVSPAHVARLTNAIEKLDRFLDPIIAVVEKGGRFWTPNGNHRLQAMKGLGAKAITALVVPEAETAYKILALNTEKAHALREKALEVSRMAKALEPLGGKESDYAFEFEEAPLLTLGLCYAENGRFAGGAYHALLRRIDAFLDEPMSKAVVERERRARRLRALEEKVSALVAALQSKGLQSPYLRAFVVARLNPLRWSKDRKPAPFDATLDAMEKGAAKFDVDKVRPDQLARSGGAPVEAD
jgi:ParB family chromosome partitioning protein